jgi:hypothetical protein
MKPKRSKHLARCPGIKKSVLAVLREDVWQTSEMIAAQIAFAPDAVSRVILTGRAVTASAAKSYIVANCIKRDARIEKRKINSHKNEYRLVKS